MSRFNRIVTTIIVVGVVFIVANVAAGFSRQAARDLRASEEGGAR